MTDPHIRAQLDATRARWILRDAAPQWRDWVARSASKAFGTLAPTLLPVRIHSLPGSFWEVLRDSAGTSCLIVDDELTACLAELRALSLPGAQADSGYDRVVLLLADALRGQRDFRRYIACMGWAMPRATRIQKLRQMALTMPGFSAQMMIILLHELAHHVVPHGGPAVSYVRDIAQLGISKLIDALGSANLREQLVAKGVSFGLDQEHADAQLTAYQQELQTNEALKEELTCDLLAAIGVLNLRSEGDLLADLDAGPRGVPTREVGDALFVAHSAIQNIQLLTAVEDIAASVSAPDERRAKLPGRIGMELTARSSAMAYALSNMLRYWCGNGCLTDDIAVRIAGGDPGFMRGVDAKNRIREETILKPLENLNEVLLDGEPVREFEATGHNRLRELGIDPCAGLKEVDAARWRMTLVASSAQWEQV
jgi:hypothetical protein